MKTGLIWAAILAVLGTAVGFSVQPAMRYFAERNRPRWKTQSMVIGEIIQSVNSTGKVEPVRRVSVGASVSGPVSELYVDFNEKVIEGQLMAKIDQRLYKASVQRDQASLRTREAEVARATAMYQQALNEERRGVELRTVKNDFISEAELDQIKFMRMTRDAELQVAKTNVEQGQAQLDNSEANLNFTEIRSPCDGIVIDRKIDIGQTLAAQFQTPEMFVVAPSMDKKMHIYASVDEADIGLIRRAQTQSQVVRFTVDAYPDELFDQGTIVQVRLSSKEEQNVITYPVIVETPNTDLKLLPGMTASLSFQIEKRSGVKKIPNSALRFYPPRERVHPDDQKILDGNAEQKESVADSAKMMSADEKADASKSQTSRHVWVSDGEFLRAKAIQVGVSDNRYTELLSGDVSEEDLLVVGEEPKKK
jgi:HlyD family secretion protein